MVTSLTKLCSHQGKRNGILSDADRSLDDKNEWGMLYMQKRKEDRVFKHYFIMYFFVLLIPMIICCTYYSYMFFVINEDDISSRKNDLVHAAARFDAVASETVRLADSLVSKAEVNKFKNMTDVMAYPNTYKINELQTSLPDLYHDNQEMYNYFIFFDNSEVVINKSIVYTYEQFYTLYMSRKDVGSFEKLEDGACKGRKALWISSLGRI